MTGERASAGMTVSSTVIEGLSCWTFAPATNNHPTAQTTLQLSKTLGETSSKWRYYDRGSAE